MNYATFRTQMVGAYIFDEAAARRPTARGGANPERAADTRGTSGIMELCGSGRGLHHAGARQAAVEAAGQARDELAGEAPSLAVLLGSCTHRPGCRP